MSALRKLLIGMSLVLAPLVGAHAIEGKYQTVKQPQPVAVPGKVEVLELFLYTCPHCYSLEPLLHDWRAALPEDVNFVRMPAVFREDSVPYAKAFYIMQTLELDEGVHNTLFNRIHKHQQDLNNPVALQKFFALEGVDKELFQKSYNSFAVDLLVRKAVEATRNFRIGAVPSMVVNGKYVVTPSLAGGQEGMIKVVNALIEKERRALELAGKSSATTPEN